MKRYIVYILLLIPLVVWAAATTIINPGNWDEPGTWQGGTIAEFPFQDVDFQNTLGGPVIVRSGFTYNISDVAMSNNNILTINAGGVLNIGSITQSRNLNLGNNCILNVSGTLEVWGDLNGVNAGVINNSSGFLIIHGDLNLSNDAVIDIHGTTTIEGNINGGDNNDINVDGTLNVFGSIDIGNGSDLTGSGTVNLTGGCTGPGSFCASGLLDTTPPVISNCPTDMTISLTGVGCDEIVNWTDPTATDDNAVDSFTSTHNSGDTFPIGITAVTYTATDLGGNVATCTFNVTIVDNTPPAISGCPTDITVSLNTGSCDEVVSWIAPTASDNCTLASFNSTHDPGDTFPIGTSVVSYIASDPTGNVTVCTFNVIVNDMTSPVISGCPTDITVSPTGANCDQVVSWTEPIASDNCSLLSFTNTHSPGETFPLGTTTVSYTATDASGNVTTCSFDVIIVDPTLPQFDFCPTSVNVDIFDVTNQNAIVTWQEPVASDNCLAPTISSNFNSGDKFPPGLTKVIYTATDVSGNTANCEFDVDVVGNKAPTGIHMAIDAYTGVPVEICLDVRDPDGDNLVLDNLSYTTLNGVIERSSTDGNLCFIYTSFDDFEGKEHIVATVCDDGTPTACVKVDVRINVAFDLTLSIYKAFTPDGDNINDVWVIDNIQNYPNNQVMIYDRLGGLIYTARGYNNVAIVWDGRSNQNGQNILPSGTYFYKIDLGSERPIQKGFIELVN